MKHKLLNPLRLLLVVICMLGIAAEGETFADGSILYNLDANTLSATITGTTGAINQETVVIPSTITFLGDDYSVTEIASSAFMNNEGGSGNNQFKHIILPETLKTIGEGAFSNCTYLEDITLPNSVEIVKIRAFAGCTSLKTVKLSESMTAIAGAMFYGCQSLESVEIPNSVDHFMESMENQMADMEQMMDDAMKYCDDFMMMYVGGSAFQGCTSLQTVILPNSIKNIAFYTFNGCSNLTKIELPEGLTYIGSYAFSGTPLKNIEIPTSISMWHYGLLDEISSGYLKSYHLNPESGVLTVGPNAALFVPKGTVSTYSSTSGWNGSQHITEATPVELESEWRTFCAVEDLDFSGVEGLEAYVATEYQDGKVLMEPIEQVPAGTGVVLKGTPGFYEIPYVKQDEALEPVDNLLVGLNYGERIQAETEDGQYNLFFNDATEMASLFYGPFMDAERAPRLNAEGEQPMFAPADGARLPYHRAYLQLPASEAGKTVEMVFDTLTGIEEVAAQPQTDSAIYNLQGQRITNPGPGIYIQNGRKFIVR